MDSGDFVDVYELNRRLDKINRELLNAMADLTMLVDGAGSVRWNYEGARLKDTREWVNFYNTFRKHSV